MSDETGMPAGRKNISDADVGAADLTRAFQAVRKRAIWFGAVPFVLGVATFLFLVFGKIDYLFGIERPVWLSVAAVLGAGGLLYQFSIYRCPRCDALVAGTGVVKGIAFDLSAKKCPNCGLPLVEAGGT